MKKLAITSLSLAVLSAVACGGESRTYDSYDETAWDVSAPEDFMGFVTDANMAITGDSMNGEMGRFTASDANATANGYQSDNMIMLDILSTNERGSALQAISLYSDRDMLEPGFQMRASAFSSAEDEGASGMLCSGAQPGNWDFDEAPAEVAVETIATDDENVVELQVETVDVDGNQMESIIFVETNEPAYRGE